MVLPCFSSSSDLAPGPQATEGAFHSSPFSAACTNKTVELLIRWYYTDVIEACNGSDIE